MRRHRGALYLPLKVVAADRLQCFRLHRIGRPILFGGQQHASPERDVRVGGGPNHPLDGFVVGVRIPIFAKQRLVVLRLVLIAVSVHISLLEVGATSTETNGRHVAIAVEVNIRLVHGGEAVVWLDAKEGAVNVFGDFARYFEVADIAFNPRGAVESSEDLCAGEIGVVIVLDTVDVVGRGCQALC